MEQAMDDEGDDGGAAPKPVASVAILSAAVAQALAQTDAKLAFDMLLLHKQLLAADAESRARTAENAALREALVAHKQEQSAMYVYLHGKLDAQVARVAELERSLSACEDAREQVERDTQEALEVLEAAHRTQLQALEEQGEHLREELRKVHVFVEQKRELEGELAGLATRLEAQQAAAKEREAALERKFLLEMDRDKREMLARMQATKEALVARTAGQLNTTTKRTMMENDQFMEELAFQSRESEALVARLDALEKELRELRVRNAVLEANEAALAKKAHYYQRILSKVRGRDKQETGVDGGRRRRRRKSGSDDSDDDSDGDSEAGDQGGDDEALRERAEELERKLRRALDWLHVVETDKQLLLAQQDEVLQFLLAALDEGARQLRAQASSPGGDGEDLEEQKEEEDARVARAGETASVDALVALFPRPLAPALDELETRALLHFLVEKLRVYQRQVAAVFHAPAPQQQQQRPSLRSVDKAKAKAAKGLELPPIHGGKSPAASPAKTKAVPTTSATTTSPLKRRAFFAHVSAAVAREEAAAAAAMVTTSPRPVQSPNSGVHPELMAMATGQFNFLAPSPAAKSKQKSAASPSRAAVKAGVSSSPSPSPSPTRRAPASKPTSKGAAVAAMLAPSDSTTELLTPWPSGEADDGEQGSEDAPAAGAASVDQ